MPVPFEKFSGIAAPMPLANINTDAVIPATYLRSPSADLGAGLFARWRYEENGTPLGDFVLNREPFDRARILIAGANFGCGSSREAAVWALLRFGIRCVVAPSFADIFYENSFRNGLLPAIVTPGVLDAMLKVSLKPDGASFAVDLAACTLTSPDGAVFAFSIPPTRRDAMVRGDDDIATTLREESHIAAFTSTDRRSRPWIYSMEDKQ